LTTQSCHPTLGSTATALQLQQFYQIVNDPDATVSLPLTPGICLEPSNRLTKEYCAYRKDAPAALTGDRNVVLLHLSDSHRILTNMLKIKFVYC